MIKVFWRCVLLALFAIPASAQGQKEVNLFAFGNSLVHHLSESEATSVPYWLSRLAEAGGHQFAVDGKWGFLRDFARELPPEPNWTIAGADSVWGNGNLAFRRVGIDTIIITPANFIQYQSADSPFDGDNPRADTPLAASGRLISWVSTQARGARILVYEGWSDMGGITSYPPDAVGFEAYQAFNAGAYHQWYQDYVSALQAEHPQVDITLIPVASVLADVMANTALAELPADVFYVDDAPHGTADLYFLASLVTYSSLYSEAPPANLELPDTLHPVIRQNYSQISARIWQQFTGALVPEAAIVSIPETGLEDPSLAMGLNGIADWSTQQPFINVMKTARPWIGHLPGQWGGVGTDELIAEGFLGPNGWPLAIPERVEALEALLLTDQPPGAVSLAGRYRVTWEGEGDLSVTGTAIDIDRETDAITFDYTPGEGLVAIRIEATDPDNPLRNIAVVHEDLRPLYEAGAVFNPQWIAKIRDLRMIRFMDWMFTNGSPQITWADRPLPGDYSYVWRGVPVEVMVQLANEIGADPWFTMPHMADDDYVRAFASTVRDRLDPRLRVYSEWSNEVWNFIFPQAVWAREQAFSRWGDDAGDDAWMQFAGLRAAQVADIWSKVFSGQEDRLVRVIATHSGWYGLEEPLFESELAMAEGLPASIESFDAYAVTGYFGFEIGEDDMADTLREWISDGTANARVTEMLRAGSFAELTNEVFTYHAGVADHFNLALVMYEGGSHVAGHGLQSQDDQLTAFYNSYNYSPEMAALYSDLLAAWRAVSPEPFNAFVDVSAPSQFGSWGALRHLDDVNPRWATLQANNAVPSGLERADGTFQHGVTRIGSDENDELTGTAEEDILLGQGGDDVLVSGGGADLLHGGPGFDRAVLPGVDADYAQGWDGDVLVLVGAMGVTRLTAMEELEFSGTPGDVQSLELPEEDPQ